MDSLAGRLPVLLTFYKKKRRWKAKKWEQEKPCFSGMRNFSFAGTVLWDIQTLFLIIILLWEVWREGVLQILFFICILRSCLLSPIGPPSLWPWVLIVLWILQWLSAAGGSTQGEFSCFWLPLCFISLLLLAYPNGGLRQPYVRVDHSFTITQQQPFIWVQFPPFSHVSY